MNFSIRPKRVPMKEILSRDEGSLNDLNKAECITIRAKVNLIQQKSNLTKYKMSKAEKASLRDLRDDNTSINLPADKVAQQSFLTKKTISAI